MAKKDIKLDNIPSLDELFSTSEDIESDVIVMDDDGLTAQKDQFNESNPDEIIMFNPEEDDIELEEFIGTGEFVNVGIHLLETFKDHPYKVNLDELQELKDSIAENGVVSPVIVRRVERFDSETFAPVITYEIISGHRRVEACRQLGMSDVDVVIRNLSDEDSTILMVDSNIHRTKVSTVEKAFAYKMRYDAIRVRNKKNKKDPLGPKADSYNTLQDTVDVLGDSATNIKRYIRITKLIPELLTLVDKRFAFRVGYELSGMSVENQKVIAEYLVHMDAKLQLKHTCELLSLTKNGIVTFEDIHRVVTLGSKTLPSITIPMYKIAKYFPTCKTHAEIEKSLIHILEALTISEESKV